jgi:micrococcal nuclease
MNLTRKIIIILLVIIAILTVLIIIVSIKQQNTIVTQVIDGDTFKLNIGETIRLTGIDAPEKTAYYYNESKTALEEMIKGKIVALERDISNKDKYGRLLRYVYVDNGTFVNLKLISEGYARAAEYPPDTKYAEELREAENDAKANNIGIWSEGLEGNADCISLGCTKGANYAGSKQSDKYHSCDSRFARMISPENLICFASEAEAREAGYVKSE